MSGHRPWPPEGPTEFPLPGKPSWLAWEAPRIVDLLETAGYAVDIRAGGSRQVHCLAEEVGEFVGAWRRWAGLARRSGTQEEMEHELADVVVTAYVTAHILDFDLDFAAAEKLKIAYARPWREHL